MHAVCQRSTTRAGVSFQVRLERHSAAGACDLRHAPASAELLVTCVVWTAPSPGFGDSIVAWDGLGAIFIHGVVLARTIDVVQVGELSLAFLHPLLVLVFDCLRTIGDTCHAPPIRKVCAGRRQMGSCCACTTGA
jgi:hypothetical protein